MSDDASGLTWLYHGHQGPAGMAGVGNPCHAAAPATRAAEATSTAQVAEEQRAIQSHSWLGLGMSWL